MSLVALSSILFLFRDRWLVLIGDFSSSKIFWSQRMSFMSSPERITAQTSRFKSHLAVLQYIGRR